MRGALCDGGAGGGGSLEVTPDLVTSPVMCSLVEIRNSQEIYIHYLNTNLTEDAIHTGDSGDVTVNNFSPVTPSVVTTDTAVQVDFADKVDRSSITALG